VPRDIAHGRRNPEEGEHDDPHRRAPRCLVVARSCCHARRLPAHRFRITEPHGYCFSRLQPRWRVSSSSSPRSASRRSRVAPTRLAAIRSLRPALQGC
jgi:hypothetical protein